MDYLTPSGIADEDPGDYYDRIAHGFTYEDDWQDESVMCRNGCGLSYSEVVGGKIRTCQAAVPDGS
jgi:hypothetical protein